MAKKKRSAVSMVTGRKPIDALYRGVIRYVEEKGGKLVVIGGVQIQQWPGEAKGCFSVAVKCMGKKPESSK